MQLVQLCFQHLNEKQSRPIRPKLIRINSMITPRPGRRKCKPIVTFTGHPGHRDRLFCSDALDVRMHLFFFTGYEYFALRDGGQCFGGNADVPFNYTVQDAIEWCGPRTSGKGSPERYHVYKITGNLFTFTIDSYCVQVKNCHGSVLTSTCIFFCLILRNICPCCQTSFSDKIFGPTNFRGWS